MGTARERQAATACASPAARVARFGARPAAPASPLRRGRFAVAGRGKGRVMGGEQAPPGSPPGTREQCVMTGHDAEIELLKQRVSCAALLERWQAGWRLD